MERPIYPSSNMRLTQGYNEGTHMDSFAIDDAGIDSGISTLKAPFTGIIKKIYSADANEVWLESIEESNQNILNILWKEPYIHKNNLRSPPNHTD